MRRHLLARRQELGLTQREVALRAGITRSHYTKIECGVRTPALKVARRIAIALQSDVDKLFFADRRDSSSHDAAALDQEYTAI